MIILIVVSSYYLTSDNKIDKAELMELFLSEMVLKQNLNRKNMSNIWNVRFWLLGDP